MDQQHWLSGVRTRSSSGRGAAQAVVNCGSSVAMEEQGKLGHPAQHQVAGSHKQYWGRGRLVQLGCCMIHGPLCRQVQNLKGAEKYQLHLNIVGASYFMFHRLQRPVINRAQPACEE